MSTSSNPIESSSVRRAACHPTKIFKGHTRWVNSVAYFPDGRRIASASDDKAVIIWDVRSGGQDGQPLLHDFSVGCIAISPDGRRIASGMQKGGVVVWDVLTRTVVHEIKCGVFRLAYSPDGRWIATAPTDILRKVQLRDTETGKLDRETLKCDGEVMCVAFSPDVSRIVVGFKDGCFQVMDISTGQSVVGPIKGHTEFVWSVVYSPDGRLVVTASRNKSIRVWDSKTGLEVGKPMLGRKYGIECISISADGRRIASGGFDRIVRVWDLETRLQVGESFATNGIVQSVAFSPDGRYVVGGENEGGVSLWDTESLVIPGPSSPPTPTPQIPPAPITQTIPPLQHKRQPRVKDTSSANSSLLDLPAVVQQQTATQQERKASVDDGDTESMRPPLRPTEPQQDLPLEQQASPAQPAKPRPKWSRDIRERWGHIRHRKSRVQTDLSDRPPHPPIPLRGRAHSSASPESSINRQARRERNADAQQNAQASHSRTRRSRNQIEANVALAQDDVRLAIAAPRGKKGRRFRERARRGGVRANSHSDTDSGSQDSDGESEEYEDTVCLDAICYWVLRRRRHLQGR